LIFLGLPNSLGFDIGLSRAFNAKNISVSHKVFPDGETYIRITEEVREPVIIVQSFFPNQNDRVIETLLTLEALRELRVKEIIGVFPYLAYTRQDKVFLKGEPVSLKALLDVMYSLGLKTLITIDVHNPNAVINYFKGRFINLMPSKLFANYVKELIGGHEIIVVSPDKGGISRAKLLASELGSEYIYLEKFRDRVTGEVSLKSPLKADLRGKVAVIVDDIISTGGTIALATKYLKSLGVTKVIAMCSHGLFIKDSLSKLRRAGTDLIASLNTVKVVEGVKYIDATPLLVEGIREVISG